MRSYIVLVLCMCLSSCIYHVKRTIPLPNSLRNEIAFHKEVKLAVFDLRGGLSNKVNLGLSQSISARLMTELKNVPRFDKTNKTIPASRFSVYPGGDVPIARTNLRSVAGLEKAQEIAPVDAYVTGTITSLDNRKTCFELQLINSYNLEILWSTNTCLRLRQDGTMAQLEMAGVKRLAYAISRALPKVGHCEVLAAEGKARILLNAGRDMGIKRGMLGYAVASSEVVEDSSIKEIVINYTGVDKVQDGGSKRHQQVTVALLYITSVDDNTSTAYIYRGSYLVPGDQIYFK